MARLLKMALLVTRTRFLLPAVLFTPSIAASLKAQTTGIVNGTVTTTGTMPVAQARVRLVGSDVATFTSIDGAFHIAAVPPGRQGLEVRRVGYTPKIVTVDVSPGAVMNLTLVLDPLTLETVKVTADANFSPGMGGFEERRARGNGRYFVREEIEKMQARQLTDVLRRVPGMRIQTGSGTFGGSQTAQSGRNAGSSGSRTCPMAYYVNGVPFQLSNDIPINHYVTPDEVVAMEVYTGASQIPAQFNSTMSTSRCGVVVIWTRSGVDARVSR